MAMTDTLETPSLVQHYQHIADISGQMLKYAQADDWGAVLELSQEYTHAVEALKPLNTLTNQHRRARKSLLMKILEDDARIRNLAAPEMARLSALIGAARRQQDVLRAYCKPALDDTPQ